MGYPDPASLPGDTLVLLRSECPFHSFTMSLGCRWRPCASVSHEPPSYSAQLHLFDTLPTAKPACVSPGWTLLRFNEQGPGKCDSSLSVMMTGHVHPGHSLWACVSKDHHQLPLSHICASSWICCRRLGRLCAQKFSDRD